AALSLNIGAVSCSVHPHHCPAVPGRSRTRLYPHCLSRIASAGPVRLVSSQPRYKPSRPPPVVWSTAYNDSLCDRNHTRCSLDQRFASFIGDQDTTTPARVKTAIGTGNDGLNDKDIAFFDQHVAIARAAILRREERSIVAIAATMH